MPRHLTVITVIIFTVALILGAFFAISTFRIIKEMGVISRPESTMFPVGAELEALIPQERVDGLTQEMLDLDGDGIDELVVGYALLAPSSITESGTLPQLRAFRRNGDSWQPIGDFSFPVQGYANSDEWRVLSGVPSFERKDFDGDRREELFIRLGTGSEFFSAALIVWWRDGKLSWLPVFDGNGEQMVPIFREGGTTAEAWRLLLEDATGGGGLEVVIAHGRFDNEKAVGQWEYEVYVERGGAYYYDDTLSRQLNDSGRSPL